MKEVVEIVINYFNGEFIVENSSLGNKKIIPLKKVTRRKNFIMYEEIIEYLLKKAKCSNSEYAILIEKSALSIFEIIVSYNNILINN